MKRFLNSLLSFLRSRTLAADVRAAPDAQLLARFASQRDEDAFAALVCRHGPMVWSVARRVLGNDADAEDAFQATFLVLARKAGSLARQDLLAGWLHGVACRTALAARSANARRRARERQAEELRRPEVTVTPLENAGWTELRPLLDSELNRLPKKYQQAIVLCDLEGKSRQEAAELLRISEGTLSSRLARGRRLLARRLSRYVPTVSGGALASALAAGAEAAVPASITTATIKTACAFAAAGPVATGVISVPVLALAEGVLKMMFLTKVKVAAGVLLASAIVCTGAALFASGMLGGDGQQRPNPFVHAQEQKKPDDNDANLPPIRRQEEEPGPRFNVRGDSDAELPVQLKEELARLKPDFRALGRQKVDAAKQAFDAYWELYRVGTTKGGQQRLFDLVTMLIVSSNNLLAAELESSSRRSERLAALENHWMRAKKAEIITEANYRAGRLGPQELYPLRYHRIDAEIKLLRARQAK